MMGKKHVELPCGQSSFFSTPENMLADAAMRGICEAAPDVLIHKNLACSYCEGAMTPEKRFSISVADPWCEGSSSQITMPEKLVFLKETYQGLGLDILGIVKGFLDAQSYITVNGMIPTEEGKVGEQTCLITGYDDFAFVNKKVYHVLIKKYTSSAHKKGYQ